MGQREERSQGQNSRHKLRQRTCQREKAREKGAATREGMPQIVNVKDLPPPSGGASSSAGPPPPSYRPGRNTRVIDATTHETRTSHGVIRERVVEEADGTMYTEITLPDGTVERDYW